VENENYGAGVFERLRDAIRMDNFKEGGIIDLLEG